MKLAPFTDFHGQVLELDVFAFTDDKGIFDDVFQLSNVPGKGIFHEAGQDLRGYSLDISSLEQVVLVDEVFCKEGDVFLSLLQRREADFDYVEPVIEVFAEGSFFHHGLQVLSLIHI